MKAQPQYPYGCCECTSCDCSNGCNGLGPAAYAVVRDGKAMNVCTRCDLPSDSSKTLLLKAEDPAECFREYDALGFMCIVFEMLKQKKAVQA